MAADLDLSKLPPAALRAAMTGGTAGWGFHSNGMEHVRYIQPIPGSGPGGRRKCRCGCGRRATHLGMANGLALTHGCEMKMRRWVRDGAD
jgi:hypothetical protein